MEEIKIQQSNIDINTPTRVEDVFGMFATVSSAPTSPPRNWFNQIKFYSSGGTKRIYMYDSKNNVWAYATLT